MDGTGLCHAEQRSRRDCGGRRPERPGVSQVNGTDIVNITAPNSNGLSHNQYLDFNVDNRGAVFNNALTAGQSQLAGMLEANKT